MHTVATKVAPKEEVRKRKLPGWLKRFRRNKAGLVGLVGVVIVVTVSILAPWIAPHDPAQQYFDGLTLSGDPLPPGTDFLLGTDLLGRDLLSRIIYGARISLIVGVVANGIAVLVGAIVGVLAGFFRGATETLLMRLTDVMTAFPALILAIALAAILRPSLWIVALVIALVNWVWVARADYSQVLSIGEREFVESARAIGANNRRTLLRHILPHLTSTMLVFGTLGVSTTVLLEAALSFLGVGVQPPTPSWGGIINESQSYFLNAPVAGLLPGPGDPAHLALLQPAGREPARRVRRVGVALAMVANYLLKRLLGAVGVLFGVSVITFLLLYLLPADPARMIAGRSATVETVNSIRAQLGLDKPLPVQYVNYMGDMLRGDLGRSYVQKAQVSELIASRLWPTVQLAIAGILFELLIGLPSGIVAAVRRGTWVDQLVMGFAFLGVSAPQFAVGLLLIYTFSYLLPIFPLGGYGSFMHIILPAITVGLAGGGWYARVTRASMTDVLRQQYVRTARAKGVKPRPVLFKVVREGSTNEAITGPESHPPGRFWSGPGGSARGQCRGVVPGRPLDTRPGDRLRLAKLVDHQVPV